MLRPTPSSNDVELAALLSKKSSSIGGGRSQLDELAGRHRILSLSWLLKRIWMIKRQLLLTAVVMSTLSIGLLGLPFPDTRLPVLEPLLANPKRAFATLHSASNPCYDMALYVALSTWKDTNSSYPMLILHSVPLPSRVQSLIESQPQQPTSAAFAFDATAPQEPTRSLLAGRLIPVPIEKRTNHFVVKNRLRSAAAKFAVWDQTDYDQLAYHDSDFVFYENGDSIFDAPADGAGNLWLYAQPYSKFWARGKKMFNSGNFLLRPNRAVYEKIIGLFGRRFWILDVHQLLKTADQAFLNAVFPWGTWDILDVKQLNPRVRHVKFWLALSGEPKFNVTSGEQDLAKIIEQRLGLQSEVEACLRHRASFN